MHHFIKSCVAYICSYFLIKRRSAAQLRHNSNIETQGVSYSLLSMNYWASLYCSWKKMNSEFYFLTTFPLRCFIQRAEEWNHSRSFCSSKILKWDFRKSLTVLPFCGLYVLISHYLLPLYYTNFWLHPSRSTYKCQTLTGRETWKSKMQVENTLHNTALHANTS